MSSRKEKVAFRRLKRIEWRLAYIQKEKKRVERNIRRLSDAWRYAFSMLILLGAILLIMSASVILTIGIPAIDAQGNPNLAGFMIGTVMGITLFIIILSWVMRDETIENFYNQKDGMEKLMARLEREREEIYQNYPDFMNREIKVRFPYDPFRVAEASVVIALFILYFLSFSDSLIHYAFFFPAEFLFLLSLFLEYLRKRQYGVGLFFRNRRNKSFNPP